MEFAIGQDVSSLEPLSKPLRVNVYFLHSETLDPRTSRPYTVPPLRPGLKFEEWSSDPWTPASRPRHSGRGEVRDGRVDRRGPRLSYVPPSYLLYYTFHCFDRVWKCGGVGSERHRVSSLTKDGGRPRGVKDPGPGRPVGTETSTPVSVKGETGDSPPSPGHPGTSVTGLDPGPPTVRRLIPSLD